MKALKTRTTMSLLGLACIAPLANAICITDVSGVINGETWTSAGSPYCIVDDVVVQDLTISGAGVRVQFMGNYTFDVIGVLNAEGTAASPVLFRPDDSNTAGWQGVKLDNVPPGNRLVHVRIDGAKNSALRVLNSYPELDDIALINSSAPQGGGLYLQLTASNETLELSNCAINSNTAAGHDTANGHGGGIYADVASGALRIVDCQIQNNDATRGSTNSSNWGGGIYFEAAADVEIVGTGTVGRSTISGNYAYSYCSGCRVTAAGGGIYMAGGNLVVRNTDISSNLANGNAPYSTDYSRGGAIYLLAGEITLINSNVDHNTATSADGNEYGGGLYTDDGRFALINSEVVYNVPGGIYNSDGLVDAVNCIVWGNQDGQIVDVVAGRVTLDNCIVDGGWPDGTGNLDCDPLFAAPFDFHLSNGSCAIDAGDDSVPGLPAMDKDGAPRIVGAHVDLGAYEFQPPAPAYCGWVGDVNGDGMISIIDALLIARYSAGLDVPNALCLRSLALQ